MRTTRKHILNRNLHLILILFFFLPLTPLPALTQITVLHTEILPLAAGSWQAERFSPSGIELYITTQGYQGIWEFSFAAGGFRQVTADPGAGYGFSISPDGKKIAYRTMIRERGLTVRRYLVVRDFRTDSAVIVLSGKSLSLPEFTEGGVAYASSGIAVESAAPVLPTQVGLLGIENTKIILQRSGVRVALDPLGNGSYIWPSLSPDRTRIVAYEMTAGTFVCDLEGRVLVRLGKRDAPAWSRDGRWIVYMDDRDDGHRLQSSDLYCVSADGATTMRLTDTPGIHEMFPRCSPTEDRIVCSTPDGVVYSISYREEGR
jgi:Tol biopolymer transport system component